MTGSVDRGPIVEVQAADGTRIALRTFPVVHGGREGDADGILFAHATGFCGAVWTPTVEELRARRHVGPAIALDFRGHGASGPGRIPVDWWDFALDVHAARAALPSDLPVIGVGHSKGGAALLMAEAQRPGRFAGLVLVEPIVFPPPFVRLPSDNPMSSTARRRRATFPSAVDAYENFASKAIFAGWDPRALQAYVEGCLVGTGDGGVRLACDPDFEAAVYEAGNAHGMWDRLSEVRVAVTIVAGERSTTHDRRLVEGLVARLPDARAVFVEEATHFVPMERPDVVADLVRAMSARIHSAMDGSSRPGA